MKCGVRSTGACTGSSTRLHIRCSPALVSCRRASCRRDGWTCCAKSPLFAAAYLAYCLVRGLVEGDANAAFAHARDLISLELTLHIFVEPSIQAWASGSRMLMDFSSWMYVNAQTTITVGALVYLYLRHNRSFYFVRNMFMIGMFIALVGYTVFPTAPPRFLPEWGFIDSVSNFTGDAHRDSSRRRRHNYRAHQHLRRRALDARGVRADDRLAARAPGAPPHRQHPGGCSIPS